VAGFCKSGNSPDDWFVTGYRQSSSLSLFSPPPNPSRLSCRRPSPPLCSWEANCTARATSPLDFSFSFAERIVEEDLFSSVENLSDFFAFWCSVFSWFLFQNPKTGGGKNAWLVTMALAFAVPEVAENLEGWGPGPASVPSQLEHVPYAPFSKADRVGRASDWTAQAFKYASGTSAFLFLFPFSSCRMSERTRGL
jgi:hypothetical protein